MDSEALLLRMERMPGAIETLLEGLPPEDWRFRPPEGGWSLLEIVNHLADEEADDFRTRLRLILEDPALDWPGLDPEGAVAARAFQERDPRESLARFRDERARSLEWLRGLRDPDWGVVKRHPRFPDMRAGDLLAAWVAHDARHLSQIGKRLHALAARDGAPFSVAYAG